MSGQEVDFVVTWVDGSDPAWLVEKKRYEQECKHYAGDDRAVRYRDWDSLKYWFRGVEAFAPWVRRVHLITWGHTPEWLNTNHPKLNVVRHEQYIHEVYLPTFNSHTIELNLHHIEGLAEQFVYFNDDMFLLRPVPKDLFFQNGLPVDDAILNPTIAAGYPHYVEYIAAHNIGVINAHFEKVDVICKAPEKWICPQYGRPWLRTMLMMPWHHFSGFVNDHLPQPFLKDTFKKVWAAEPDVLHETCTHRFRDYGRDVNQWLMRYWQFCENRFVPIAPRKRGKDLSLLREETFAKIRKQCYSMICLNDEASFSDETFGQKKDALKRAFESILPNQCAFEC